MAVCNTLGMMEGCLTAAHLLEPGPEEPLRTRRSQVRFWNCLAEAETTVVGYEIVVCPRPAFDSSVVITRRAV